MADNKSDYLERKVLDHILGTTAYTKPSMVYVSLHTADPTDAATSNEVSGGSYVRKAATFTAATTTSGVTSASNAADIVWTDMPATLVSHVGIWDASTSGNLLLHAPFDTSKTLSSGDGYTISASQLTIIEQ